MKELEKQFGGIEKLVKNLKTTVESLVEKVSKQENDEIKETSWGWAVPSSGQAKVNFV